MTIVPVIQHNLCKHYEASEESEFQSTVMWLCSKLAAHMKCSTKTIKIVTVDIIFPLTRCDNNYIIKTMLQHFYDDLVDKYYI
jgi:hypothetical protein